MGWKKFLLKFYTAVSNGENSTLVIKAACDPYQEAPEHYVSPEGEAEIAVSCAEIDSEKSGALWMDEMGLSIRGFSENAILLTVKNKTEESLRVIVEELSWEVLFGKKCLE